MSLSDFLNARFPESANSTSENPPEAEKAETPEPEEAEAETTAEEAETSEEGEPELDAKSQRQLAKALADLQRTQSESLKAKRELEDLRSLINEAKSDPKKALKLAGTDFGELIQKTLKGEFKADDAEKEPGDPKVRELEERLSAVEREKQELLIKQEKDYLRGELAKADDFAVVAALPWTADRIHGEFYRLAKETGETPVLADVVNKVQSAITADLEHLFGSEKALKAVLKANPKLKNALVSALGLDQQDTKQPARQDSKSAESTGIRGQARGLSSKDASEIPSRKPEKKLSEKERVSRAAALLASRFRD
jgi:hypothetical protein